MPGDGAVIWSLSTLGLVLGALALQAGLRRILVRVTRRTPIAKELSDRTQNPGRVVIAGIVAYAATFGAPFSTELRAALQHLLALALIGAFAWLIVEIGFVLMDAVMRRHEIEARDNLLARKVRTQIIVLKKVLVVVVSVLALAAALTTFAEARTLGASILASAGVVGLVAGVAARSTLGNLLAGVQIAFTEPIRLDDVVVVEGEWGRVEDITLTYVVVRIWDERRLVLPISYFIETPFQNWTRTRSDLLATAYVYADYTVPVERVREEFSCILGESELWDGRVSVLQVTDATQNTVQLRALMSAPDAGTAWDLRCEVREKLIAFLQERYPGSLPRMRAEVTPAEEMSRGPEDVFARH